MSLQFITGNSGNGKTKYLFNRIVKEAKANPRDNYLVIVPEQFTMQTQRQLVDLSENKAIMNIDVLSFKRLAYRVFDELGITNLTVLEETGKNLVLRKLAAQEADKLGVIGRNLNRIGYISEVKSLLSELVQYNISPEELGRYIASGRLSDTLSDKLKDVLVLYEAFEKFMQDKYITAEEILNVLCNVAEESAILRNSVIAFDEFTGFTPIQNQLIKKLFVISKKIYVTLTIDCREDIFKSRGMQELFDMPKRTVKSLTEMAAFYGIEVEEPIILDKNYRLAENEELSFMEQQLFRKRRCSISFSSIISAFEKPEHKSSTVSSSSCDTLSFAQTPIMPSPTMAGVFGMVRITFKLFPNISSNHESDLPGAIETMISSSLTVSFISAITSS